MVTKKKKVNMSQVVFTTLKCESTGLQGSEVSQASLPNQYRTNTIQKFLSAKIVKSELVLRNNLMLLGSHIPIFSQKTRTDLHRISINLRCKMDAN